MRKIIAILIAILIGCGANCFAQGKVSNKKNTATTQSSKPRVKKQTTPKLEGELNGHEWVDLGLPSGTKWAVYNLGANKYEMNGEKFNWGMTYPSQSYAKQVVPIFDDISGNIEYDAATKRRGKGWATPSKFDYLELINECKIKGDTINDVIGARFTGPNGKSIFLPTYERFVTTSDNLCELYWTSTPVSEELSHAVRICSDGSAIFFNGYSKVYYLFIRPVIRKSK